MMFCDQLQDAAKKYHNLKIYQDDNGISYLKGILDVPNDNGEVAGSFLTEVHYSSKFPYRFPILFETGGDIPNVADFHKYTNASCCITVTADEIIKCKHGITVPFFIEKYAIPYFANYIYRKETGEYKDEYAHAGKGVFQFYERLMKTGNTKLWIQYYENAFQNMNVSCGRNDMCFCGSQKKYKHCHLEVFNTLRIIGGEQVLNDFKKIIE